VATDEPKSYLTLSNEAGEAVGAIPVIRNGGSLRIAVGGVGHRSSIWRIWTNKNDVYVAVRNVAGEQKFSLHKSGRWRYAYTSQAAQKRLTEEQDRVLDKWDRPAANDGGLVAALAIEVRAEDVADVDPDDTKPGDVFWIPTPPAGHYVSIRISIVTPDTGYSVDVGGHLVAFLGLPDTRGVAIAYAVLKQEPERWANVDSQRREALSRIELSSGIPALRMAVFAFDEATGLRMVYDTAIRPTEIPSADT
jgi:hypothetical protein